MKQTVIIVAGGSGKRMGTAVPKQFLILANKPIIVHTVERFLVYNSSIEIVVVLPQDQLSKWENICDKYNLKVKTTIGGKERFHSVKNGLNEATGDLIAIHDGVRPLVSVETISNSFNAAKALGSGIPTTPVVESLRIKKDNTTKAVNRADYLAVQTPQCFSRKIIMEAYKQPFSTAFTDDATVVEAAGYAVNTVNGNTENIKITNQIDLKLAELLAPC